MNFIIFIRVFIDIKQTIKYIVCTAKRVAKELINQEQYYNQKKKNHLLKNKKGIL